MAFTVLLFLGAYGKVRFELDRLATPLNIITPITEDPFQCGQYNDDEEQCFGVPECQPLYNDINEYLSCIPVDDGDGDGSGDGSGSDDGSGDGSGHGSEDGSGHGSGHGSDEVSCGHGLIQICHIPKGRHENVRTICVSQRGFYHGHKKKHKSDHQGACSESDLEDNY